MQTTPQPIPPPRFARAAVCAFDKLSAGAAVHKPSARDRSRARSCLAVICLAATLAAVAAASSAAEEARLGIVHFTPPAGWQSANDAARNAIVFVPPDSTADRMVAIVVLLTPPLGQSFDFPARFAKAVESTADGRPVTEPGKTLPGKSRQGCDTLEQTFAYENLAGQTVRARLVAARVGDRLAAFCYLASSEDLFRKHDADMVNLLSSVRFDGLPATASSTNATGSAPAVPGQAPAATRPATSPGAGSAVTPELQAIEQEKADLQKRLADLESRERQLNHALTTEPSSAPGSDDPSGSRATTGPAGTAGAIDVTDRSRGGAWLRGRYPKRTRFLLTLTPAPNATADAGPRTVSCDVSQLPETVRFSGLPAGNYRLAARAVTPDQKNWPLKLTVSSRPEVADWSDSLEIDSAKGVTVGVTDAPK